ncbi:hypothetical protein GO755_29550 [Spirosoma sp. HMF4905]|uniref:Uncharacterized protein n=1 Tax=Spirosoma arboris TaxID=2682092 RepID=A0A7K1SKG8_9BACT|nr:hypothetical protein [Spirosoma arboris]MVM34213.1 hypothetical protein [Spirosoma arboris]
MCNTEQNYVGRGNNAIPSTPPAQNAAQPPVPGDDRRAYFHRIADHPGASEYLESLLELIGDYLNTTTPIPAINNICMGWMQHTHNSPWLSAGDKDSLSTILSLTTFLVRLKSCHEAFLIEESSLVQTQREDDE